MHWQRPDSVIVPVQAQYLPAKGMTQLMKTIGKVQRQINPALKVDGVLLTLADMRTNLARVTAESIRQNYGRMVKVYQTVIPVWRESGGNKRRRTEHLQL